MKGDIPLLLVKGKTLPEVWERAVLSVWKKGVEVRTEYDRPSEPASRDCSMVMIVSEPMSEPRIHRSFPAGLEDLEIYRQEVIEGIHDSWIRPEEGKWSYTYHERLFDYKIEGKRINQIEYLVRKLSEVDYSRRAQAVTWSVLTDPPSSDPPCLQRIWCRLLRDKKGRLFLNMNTHWRSRDAFKASFMNMFAFTSLQAELARRISEARKEEILTGRYIDISDSFHIYGSYFGEFRGFLKTVKSRSFSERTWHTQFAQPFFEEARKKINEEKR